MWPKNIFIYTIDTTYDAHHVDGALSNRPYSPPLGLDWFSEGWTVHPHNSLYVQELHGNAQVITLQRTDKILPSSAIREILDSKVQQLENEEYRKVGHKERQALKEQITDDLLPKAFTRSSKTAGYLDFGHGLVMIDTTSLGKAENFLSCLRDCLPAFPTRLPHTQLSPQSAMTEWLITGDAPEGFELGYECDLEIGGDNGAIIKCRRQYLLSGEIQNHLRLGKRATSLALVWRDRVRFILTDQLALKRIKFLDVIQEEVAQSSDDEASLIYATRLMVKDELAALISDLITALGGYQ